MHIKPTDLRNNLFQLLDYVLKTGVPVEIERKGQVLKLIRSKPISKLKNLRKREIFNCDPEELVHIDWSNEWKTKYI